ncbi:ferritin-like domain-containing protein [Mesonia aquimarina]|uniref:ferritin-like domain-containing protein n=1 Tax=Mesonia aquimarina TaxID=1504967 RepID=UPI000EF61A33|nr:PA2169 family four-helix-bundle protein [Mesonia aquimarina]
MNQNETAKKINDLIEKNNDAVKGFKEAADNAESQELKSFLINQSRERASFAQDLSEKLNVNYPDEKIDTDGSTTGKIHRGWISFKSALSVDDDEAILEECIRGDKAAKKEYEEALSNFSDFPQSIANLISTQKNKIERTLNEVKTLEDLH